MLRRRSPESEGGACTPHRRQGSLIARIGSAAQSNALARPFLCIDIGGLAMQRAAFVCSFALTLLGLGLDRASTAHAADATPSHKPKAQPRACELFSAAEVAAFLSAPAAQIDSVDSGFNENTHADLCNWYVHKGSPQGLTFKVRRAQSADETAVILLAARLDENLTLDHAQPIHSLGDEALYLPYPDGTGGTLIVRKATAVLTIIGSVKRDTLVAIAAKAIARL
jgi:hypothetical protein